MTSFAVAAALGVFYITIADRLKISAIVVLLLGGILAGPEVLGIVRPEALGDGLGAIISLAVAIILFEGGLTLDIDGYRKMTGEIWRILTLGVLITWLGSTALLRIIFGFDWDFCLLASSLIIVTGPTVIGPLLHRIRVKKHLHHILHWEGVLIDPIGVFIALFCFEYFISTDGTHQLVVKDLVMRFVIGGALGLSFGYTLDFVLRRQWVAEGHTNIFVLVIAMLNFTIADLIIAESGLLSVTINGLILGYRKTPNLRNIVSYKVELKDFLIGLLFVLLCANLKLETFLAFGWKLPLLVAGVMLLVRPANIFISMRGGSLKLKDKLFLSWIAPRGIVAASMASIFALKLQDNNAEQAIFLEAFTYTMIAGTVIVQGFSAGAIGRMLGVLRPVPTGWIIVGAHALGREVARFLRKADLDVILIDTNARAVRDAQRMNLTTFNEDAMQLHPEANAEFYGCGNFLALTANSDLNRMLCRRWNDELEDGHMFRWEKKGYETEAQKHLLVGERIWSELPLHRLMDDTTEPLPIHVRKRGPGPLPDLNNILLTVRNGSLIAGKPNAIHKDDEYWLLYDPARNKNHLALPLLPDNVLFFPQTEPQAIYEAMLRHLARSYPEIVPKTIAMEMVEHEAAYAGLLGNGIALPHTWSDAVSSPILVVGRARKGDESSPASKTQLVFMLLSPKGQPREHLKYVSHIARLIGSQAQREALLEAVDEATLYTLIAES